MEKTIGMRIRECRKKLGMTQEELAEQICCKKSLISQYENDKVDINGSIIVELAQKFGTTTGYILNGELGCDLDEDEQNIIKLLSVLKDPLLKKIALEQVKVLCNIYYS